ncbi:sulfide/dihydroorotate dehydrogenase-like FAD/NAD-binding protein [Ruminococcaceae bacterium OttesenSCG-928-N02]|nr:sulfide/dihydroorotate dehydrogenase-like FAD/NAD-binding protein [Ruminococcaceae bacterium OttesenSCG-928-N02]
MFEILTKRALNPTVTQMEIFAPQVAKKALAGQFIILRTDAQGERIPLTVAGVDVARGAVCIIFQRVGATTQRLHHLQVGDTLCDFVGPLGTPSKLAGIKKAAVVGGGVGCAIALPVAAALHNMGAQVDAITGFRSKDLVILQNEFAAASTNLYTVTDDGTFGQKGLVTDILRTLLATGAAYDEVFAIGPLIMMKFVCALTKEFAVKTTVSMNPIMIDGTGMCGCCRLQVGGEMKFACVDGPEFDGHQVDFDEAINRAGAYRAFEKERHEETCNLFLKGVQ